MPMVFETVPLGATWTERQHRIQVLLMRQCKSGRDRPYYKTLADE